MTHKIIEGLKEAVRYAQCSHDFTPWQPKGQNHSRHCYRCGCTEYKVKPSVIDPTAYLGQAPAYKVQHSPKGVFVSGQRG